jgi:1-acyl-sn-glycerol-3-phosphate acyltransferase
MSRQRAEAEFEEALAALHETVRAQLARHESQPLDLPTAFDAVRRRVQTLGMSERAGEVDDFGLDPVVVDRSRRFFEWLRRRYWRLEMQGIDNVPTSGPVLFVGNRSGLFPFDGLMSAHVIERELPAIARPRFLVADWLIKQPFAQPFLARLGGVRACPENATRLLQMGTSVVAFPEGAKGATKLFRDRYRLRRFGRGGVLRLARATGVPVVPLAIVGAEEIYPILMRSRTLARQLGVPLFPVTPTFPWLGLAGALPPPSTWYTECGEPFEMPSRPLAGSSEELLIAEQTDRLRLELQTLVDRLARARERERDRSAEGAA